MTELTKLWNMVKGHLETNTLKKVAEEFPEFAEEASRLADERDVNKGFLGYLGSIQAKNQRR